MNKLSKDDIVELLQEIYTDFSFSKNVLQDASKSISEIQQTINRELLKNNSHRLILSTIIKTLKEAQ